MSKRKTEEFVIFSIHSAFADHSIYTNEYLRQFLPKNHTVLEITPKLKAKILAAREMVSQKNPIQEIGEVTTVSFYDHSLSENIGQKVQEYDGAFKTNFQVYHEEDDSIEDSFTLFVNSKGFFLRQEGTFYENEKGKELEFPFLISPIFLFSDL